MEIDEWLLRKECVCLSSCFLSMSFGINALYELIRILIVK